MRERKTLRREIKDCSKKGEVDTRFCTLSFPMIDMIPNELDL